MKRRKPYNARACLARSCQALLNSNYVCVVNIDPSGSQNMFNYKNAKRITSRSVLDAIFDFPHQWTIYISCMCRRQDGSEYLKSVEIAPLGIYLASHLTETIEHHYTDLRASCNATHLVAYGWLAVPNAVSLDEAQAAKVFKAAGAWNQVKVAA